MSIEFGCCECRKLLRVPETSAGKRARCPACGSIQEVPPRRAESTSSAVDTPRHEAAPPASRTDSPFAAEPASSNPFADRASAAVENPFADDRTNPYAAPPSRAGMASPSLLGGSTREWARTCVEGPANSMAAIGGVVLIFSAIGLAINLTSLVVDGNLEGTAWAVGSTLVGCIPYGIILYGANQMKQLKNYNLAIASSVLAMLPCSACCIFGLPVGIWSLVVLCNPDVRAAFY